MSSKSQKSGGDEGGDEDGREGRGTRGCRGGRGRRGGRGSPRGGRGRRGGGRGERGGDSTGGRGERGGRSRGVRSRGGRGGRGGDSMGGRGGRGGDSSDNSRMKGPDRTQEQVDQFTQESLKLKRARKKLKKSVAMPDGGRAVFTAEHDVNETTKRLFKGYCLDGNSFEKGQERLTLVKTNIRDQRQAFIYAVKYIALSEKLQKMNPEKPWNFGPEVRKLLFNRFELDPTTFTTLGPKGPWAKSTTEGAKGPWDLVKLHMLGKAYAKVFKDNADFLASIVQPDSELPDPAVTLKLQRHDELLDIIIKHVDQEFGKTGRDYTKLTKTMKTLKDQAKAYHKHLKMLNERMDEYDEDMGKVKEDMGKVKSDIQGIKEEQTRMNEKIDFLMQIRNSSAQQHQQPRSQAGSFAGDRNHQQQQPPSREHVGEEASSQTRNNNNMQAANVELDDDVASAESGCKIGDNVGSSPPSFDNQAAAASAAQLQNMVGGALRKPLTAEETERVKEALNGNGSKAEIVAEVESDTVTRGSIQRLRREDSLTDEQMWLNDEIISIFFKMLAIRDAQLCDETDQKRCYLFKSFFMAKLLNEGDPEKDGMYEYKNVRRWSARKGIDIFSLDKIFFPINCHGSHWILAVVFMQEKKIQMYDSFHGSHMKYLEHLLEYLKDEHTDKKKGEPLPNDDDWELIETNIDETPRQHNGYDCGVFICMFAYFLSAGRGLEFSQNETEHCRRFIALSILRGFVM